MGAPKQKWTTAEEAALKAGVKKHGLGKWRAIQKDPEFTFLLATRSNVDLKDKWRNMNIGVPGYVSREKQTKALSKQRALKGTDEPLSPLPLALLPGDLSAEDSFGLADALVSSDSPKETKSLGPRYTDMVLDAIVDLNSPTGASSSDIASFIEANNLVPANFRRLLRLKLKDMVKEGSLTKVKDNYKVYAPEEVDEGNQSSEMLLVAKRKMRGVVKGRGFDNSDDKRFRDESISDLTIRPPSKQYVKGLRGDRGTEKALLDVDYARLKLKTAEEAARAAALAMAEAEAAAAAAEKAAKKARAAEAEAEAAEIAAEVAALAARPPKKARRAVLPVEEVAVAV